MGVEPRLEEVGAPPVGRRLLLLVVAAAAVVALAGHGRPTPPAPGPGVVRSTAPLPAASEASPPRAPRTIPLPDGQPPTLVGLTTDGRRAVLSSSFGAREAGTVVVDLEAGTARLLPLGGGVLDAARGQVVGWAVSAPGDADPDLIVAVRLADGLEAWRTRVGFCGGAFALAGDRVHAVFQGGGRRRPAGADGPESRGGDDPLLVLDAATGALLGGPRRTGGVVGVVVADAAGRSWVGADRRTICFGPPPDLAFEHELHGARVAAIDPASGRLFLHGHETPSRLVTLDGPLAAPVRTDLLLPGALAVDPAGRRLFAADQAAGRIQLRDARTLALERTLVVDPVAMQSALAVTPDGRRLLVATATGTRRTLHVLELD